MNILKSLLAGGLQMIPIVGDYLDNINSSEGGVGKFFRPAFIKQIIRLVVALGIFYLIIKGDATVEDLKGV